MSTRFDDYQRVLKNERFHRQVETVMMAAQTALMANMAGSLNHLQAEMISIRQLQLEGLAIQQEMLNRDLLQGQLEEFIYNTEKMVQSFSEAESGVQPSAQYFVLLGIRETVKQLGIGTALIRGRENKAAFESAMEQVAGLLGQLKVHPEVIEALAWVKSEQQRVAEKRRKQAAKEQKLLAQQLAVQSVRRDEIEAAIRELRTKRTSIVFSEWFEKTFENFLKSMPRPVAMMLLFAPLPFGAYGFIWIPLWFSVSKKSAESQNAPIDKQIAELEQEAASLGHPSDVAIVRSFRPPGLPGVTLGELVDAFIEMPDWTTAKTQSGENLVVCKGFLFKDGIRAPGVFQFLVSGNQQSLFSVEINDVPLNGTEAQFHQRLIEHYHLRYPNHHHPRPKRTLASIWSEARNSPKWKASKPGVIHAAKLVLVFAGAFLVFVFISLGRVMNKKMDS